MPKIRTQVWAQLGAAPKSVLGIASVVIALLVGFAPMMTRGWTKTSIITAIVLAGLSILVAVAQDSRDKTAATELQTLRDEHNKCIGLQEEAVQEAAAEKDEEYADYIAWLCQQRLAIMLHQIAECFATTGAPERRVKTSKARTSVLNAAAELVGNVDKGTRANIFKLVTAEDGTEKMVSDGFWGRGDQSTREFCQGMATFDKAMEGLGRFQSQTGRKDSDGNELAYETYLTYPIKEGAGKLYGVLTVDCLHEGELQKGPDEARMSVLAAMLAMTYRAEHVRPTTGLA